MNFCMFMQPAKSEASRRGGVVNGVGKLKRTLKVATLRTGSVDRQSRGALNALS